MADKFGLRTWIFGFACQVFKTTYIDREKALYEDAFFFTRRMLFPPLDKRNTRDKAKGLCIASERHIGELGVRCLSTLHRGQDSAATVSNNYCFAPRSHRAVRTTLHTSPSFPYPKDKEKPPPTDVTSSVSGGYPVGYFLSDYAYSL